MSIFLPVKTKIVWCDPNTAIPVTSDAIERRYVNSPYFSGPNCAAI